MSRPRKSAPAEPCRHWTLTLGGRAAVCNDCEHPFAIELDPAVTAQADRDAHNAHALQSMNGGYLPGMESEEI
jgi:hypothetical protein